MHHQCMSLILKRCCFCVAVWMHARVSSLPRSDVCQLALKMSPHAKKETETECSIGKAVLLLFTVRAGVGRCNQTLQSLTD